MCGLALSSISITEYCYQALSVSIIWLKLDCLLNISQSWTLHTDRHKKTMHFKFIRYSLSQTCWISTGFLPLYVLILNTALSVTVANTVSYCTKPGCQEAGRLTFTEFRGNYWCLFIVLSKAFNTVDHTILWQRLLGAEAVVCKWWQTQFDVFAS